MVFRGLHFARRLRALGVLASCVVVAGAGGACSHGGPEADPFFRLLVTSTGGGSIVSEPAGIDCGPACTESSLLLRPGARVTLTATAATGRSFLGWSGDCSGTGSCVVTLTRDVTVSASFSGVRVDGGPLPTVDGGGTQVVQVRIEAPAEGSLITTQSVPVSARITAGAPLDASKLTAQVGALTPTRLSVTSDPDLYTASVPLVTLASGGYDLVVRAATVDNRTGSATRRLLIDAGPVITVARPSQNEPVRDALTFDVTVATAPELQGRATVTSVTATVGQCAVPLGAAGATGRYTGAFQLAGCTPALPSGLQQLLIVANDSAGATSQKITAFVIDRDGPTVVIRSPATGQLVGGIMNIEAEVRDVPSGVDASSVQATVSHGGTGFTVQLLPLGGDRYAAPFDTRRLPDPTTIQFPSVQVVARDLADNRTISGGLTVTLDNVPPIGELDPLPWELVQLRGANPPVCSRPFDPVGDESANDLETVPQLFYLRGVVRDMGNVGVGSSVVIVSKVKEVTLHVLGETSRPLVVDSDGDGTCDDINPQVIPTPGTPRTPSQALALALQKVPQAGNADFRPTDDFYAFDCVSGADTNGPPRLCTTTSLTYVLQDHDIGEPLLWAIPPLTAPGSGVCTGIQFDAGGNNMPDGWICAALSFVDNVGNRSVSAPLRLCLKKDGGACAATSGPPSCAGTLDRTSGNVGAPACSPAYFPGLSYVRRR